MKVTGTSIFNIRHSLFDIAFVLALSGAAHAQGRYQTLGPAGCGIGQPNCHAGQNKNMVDQHKSSSDNIRDAENSQKYADALGIKDFFKGTSRCMDCHGTIVSGKEGKDVEEGVSCESCHGPGSGYKDPHSGGPKGGPGVIRDGYTKALTLGMRDLKQPGEIAKVCVRCHYTTDQKLLAAGHPDGAKFAYATKMKSVAKHWNYRDKGNIPEAQVFKDAVAGRPVAAKPIAEKPVVEKKPAPTPPSGEPKKTPPPPGNQQTKEAKSVATPVVDNTPPQPRVRKPPPPPRTPVVDLSAAPPPTKEPIVLPPFPTITDSTRIDQTLLLLKRRLELLYKKTGS